jgi:serine protease AprX
MLTCILVLGSTAVAGRKKTADDLDVQSSAWVSVIVQYADGPSATHANKAKNHGARVMQDYQFVKATTMSLQANQIAGLLADDSTITYVSPDRPVQPSGFTAQFQAVDADIAQSYGYSGTGVTVAVIDSGIGSHADLSGRVLYSQDFTGEGTDDLYGHGTHVAGIIGGNGLDSTGPLFARTFKGVAPNVNLISLKALDINGGGQEANVIAAIQAAIALKSTYNIRVINLSLGRGIYESCTTDPLAQAVEQAWKAGIFVVVAAGNYGRDNSNNRSGYGTITSPGNDPTSSPWAQCAPGTPDRSDDVITQLQLERTELHRSRGEA